MGYTTDFSGQITIDPPLSAQEVAFLLKFNQTRRMDREKGPYFVDGTGNSGQGDDPDIRDHNCPPLGQPGLWCQWTPTDNGQYLEWDMGEKFSDSAEWMLYLIEHFLKPDCLAKDALFLLQANHILNGEIRAQGQDADDRWILVVKNNKVTIAELVDRRLPGWNVQWDVVDGRSHYGRRRLA